MNLRTVRNYTNGKWVEAETTNYLDVENPTTGQVDECGDNPNPWSRERWNPFHEGQCYRRSNPSGSGGSQCCYDSNGNLIEDEGSYDFFSPIHLYNWPGHFLIDMLPAFIWYGTAE